MSNVTIYSLEVFHSQFGTGPLFPFLPIWFKLLLLDLHKVSQEAGKEVCSSHLLKNFPQFVVIHTVNESEADVFWNSLAFSLIHQMLAM